MEFLFTNIEKLRQSRRKKKIDLPQSKPIKKRLKNWRRKE